MNHLRVLLVIAMMLAFGAGAVIGIGRGKSSRHEESSLSKELKLSSEQETQIREIWSKMLECGPQEDERREVARDKRDSDIAALLSAEQKEKYQKIQGDYQTEMHAIETQRDATFADAEAKTRALLTPEQAKKFDEMIHRDRPHGGPPRFMDGRPHGPPPPGPGF